MNMEKFGGFVPEKKRVEFDAAAQKGEKSMVESELFKSRAEEEKDSAKKKLKIAAGVGALGIASAPLTGAIGPTVAGVWTGILGAEAGSLWKKAKEHSKKAEIAGKEGEIKYNRSRHIVEEEMLKTGANINSKGELRASPEQIQAAQEDMNKDLDSRQ